MLPMPYARFALCLCFILGSSLVAQEPEALISGTGLAVPAHDPRHGGWDTELLAEQAGHQIESLEGLLKEPAKLSDEALAEIIAPDATMDMLRPEALAQVYQDAAITVRRWSGKKMASSKSLASCQSLLGQFPEGVSYAKAKIVRVRLEKGSAMTEVELQWEGKWKGAARAQVNTHWLCAWHRRAEQAPLLAKLSLRHYEEVIINSPAKWFADCTQSVLGAEPAFASQLAPGVDHWLGRMDMATGMEVGGWHGLAIGDANGDGLEDLYLCQSGALPNKLFLQQADGSLRDMAADAGVDWLEQSRGALFVDLDNDGDQDLVVSVFEGLMIHENDGKGGFHKCQGRVIAHGLPYSLAAADYDADGDLDLFAACYDRRGHVDRNLAIARPVPYHDANNGARNVLLRNDGQFRFREVTKAVGLDANNLKYSYAATWGDYDNDGDLDLYVANDFGRNNLYRQDRATNGAIQFTDVAEPAGVLDIGAGMSASWGDYNNDGWLDLYVSNMFSSAGNRIATQSQFLQGADEATRGLFLRHARGNSLFRNLGVPDAKGRIFADVSESAAVSQGRWAWGSIFADLNNDGWEDIVVANGFITHPDPGDL